MLCSGDENEKSILSYAVYVEQIAQKGVGDWRDSGQCGFSSQYQLTLLFGAIMAHALLKPISDKTTESHYSTDELAARGINQSL